MGEMKAPAPNHRLQGTTKRWTTLLAALALAACASGPTGPGGPLEYVPESFLARYPVGTQERDYFEVLVRLRDYWLGVARLWDASLHHRGGMCVAFAVRPDGSVAAVEKLSSSLEDPDFERQLLETAMHFQFGPARGTGNYVFGVSLDTKRRWIPYCERAS